MTSRHPSKRIALGVAALLLSGCAAPVNTLLPVRSPGAPIEQFTLFVPEGLEIQSVDYDAAVFSAAPGSTTPAGEIGGRSFVKAYAVERSSGTQYLLIYENIGVRQEPTQIIRFEARAIP